MAIKLIVGLGNLGTEYDDTRHNAGFWLVDALAQEFGVAFKAERGFHGKVARVSGAAGGAWLLKPSTYMNRSGQSVLALASFYKILPDEILVVHDELDLPPGGIKMKKSGGHAGHNGLKDIQARLATPEFWRLRIGIGHPGVRAEVANWVLRKPPLDDRIAIDQNIAESLSALPLLLDGEMARALAKIHAKPQRPSPPRPVGAVATGTAPAPAPAPTEQDPSPTSTEQLR